MTMMLVSTLRGARLLAVAALLVGLLGQLGGARSAQAAALTVTTTADELNADGDCALREAIRAANLDTVVDACPAGSGADTITLPAGTYTLSIAGTEEEAGLTGDLDLSGTLTISGAGAATTIIDGGKLDRVLDVSATANVTVSGVTIRNGDPGFGEGGGIQNKGSLTLFAATVSGNTSRTGLGGVGGGIANTGILSLTNSRVGNNRALFGTDSREPDPGVGAGIANRGGDVTLTNTLVHDNVAAISNMGDAEGGGIWTQDGSLTLNSSTVTGNVAAYGAGIRSFRGSLRLTNSVVSHNDGHGIQSSSLTTTITSSTFSHNAGDGLFLLGTDNGTATISNSSFVGNTRSGISNFATLSVKSSTITGNQAGGLRNFDYDGSVTIANTLIANNIGGYPADGPDCSGTATSQGYNLISSTTGCTITGDTTGNLLNVNPLLGPLRDNGGPTQTHALLPGSPAIDAGNPATPGSAGNVCPTTDQRGVARPQDGNSDGTSRCDIGAVERQDNFVLNGSFEQDSNADGTPDAWSANARATRTSAAAQSGTAALRHQATDNASYTVFSDPIVPVVAGQRYTVSGWVNIPPTSDTFSLELQVRWRDAASTVLSTVPVQTYSAATGGWTSFSATLIAPPTATQATIRQAVTSLNATLYVDDLRLRPVDDLVLNGSFEQDSNADGTPDAWSANARATRTSAAAQSGTAALRHQATDNASYTVFSDPIVPVVAGQRYTVSGWVNIPPTSDTFSLELQVRWRDAASTVLSTVPVQSYSATTGGWTSFSATLIAPPTATQATIRQAVTSLNATLYVDDLRLRPVDDLVLNGSFEQDSNADGTPDAWSANARATRTSAAAQSGTAALRHQATDNASYTVFSDPIVPVVAGQRYTVSGWVNIPPTSDTFSLELQVRWRDTASTVLSTVPVQSYSAATGGWTSFSATLIAPPTATQATIRQAVTSLNATLYVDDLVFGP